MIRNEWKRLRNLSLQGKKWFTYQSISSSCTCTEHFTLSRCTRWKVKSQPTIICIGEDCNRGFWELGAHTSSHGHAEAHDEALLLLVQGVVDDHHPAGLLHLAFVEAQDAVVVLGPGDVVGVGEHRGGDGARGRDWARRETEWQKDDPKYATSEYSPHTLIWVP